MDSRQEQQTIDERELQRRRVRRSTLIFSLIALAFYLGFILMSISKSMK
jgi:uncharacterized membrane protein (DUF485 family)